LGWYHCSNQPRRSTSASVTLPSAGNGSAGGASVTNSLRRVFSMVRPRTLGAFGTPAFCSMLSRNFGTTR
jgi:hypothetical protein